MEVLYKARYYDGHSTKPIVVNVAIQPIGISIYVPQENQEPTVLEWYKSSIIETEITSTIIILRYGELFPYQQLEITDPDFNKQYRTIFPRSFFNNWFHFSTPKIIGLLLLGFVLTLLAAYFFILPFIADQVAQKIPVSYEIKMGKELYDGMIKDQPIDSSKTEIINSFFKQLNIQTEYPIRIVVIQDSIVNAFAMPGGGIVVYEGILNKIQSSEELAALLAHEYSHIELKHSIRNIFRTLAGSFFVSIIFSDLNGLTALVIDNAHQLQNLSYSRELELEADANGLQLLQNQLISTKGMIQLFETLKKENELTVNELISTHPDLEKRIEHVKFFQEKNPIQSEAPDSLAFYFHQLKTPSEW